MMVNIIILINNLDKIYNLIIKGEIFVSENDKFKIINTMGHIFSFCSAGGSEFALGRNQSI
jgi:hypothetical protein